MMNTDEQWLNPEAVIEAVCQVSGLSRDTILGRDRTQPVSMARKIMCHLLYKRSNLSVEGIGHLMSHRDHTSILYLKKQALLLPEYLVKIYRNKAELLHQQILNNVSM